MSTKNKKKRQTYSSTKAAANKSSNKALIWLTLIFLAVIAIIVLGMNNQSKGYDFDYSGLPMQGSKDAPVKIVEFGDFKCPTCQYFAQNIEPQIKKDFIDTGKASMYFVNYPFLGPDSDWAAYAAQAVYHQNPEAFWPYYKAIYDNQKDERTVWATPEVLVQLARDAKLDIDFDKLKTDIEKQTYKKEVDDQEAMVRPAGVEGTPAVFINGKMYKGDLDYKDIQAAINKAVEGK
ncbi:DsbA family protein [Paenibacillus sp. GCM10023252]|uniref:DsbA family protein n=1 Tax=Paenibacillus sp. GCM10023252 TaxID=3252649 RepID=UPI00361196C4